VGRNLESEDRLERQVLGALLRDGAVIADVVRLLREDDFRVDAHRRVWSAIIALWDEGKPVDPAGLADLLHRRGWVHDVGGYAFLGQLWEEVPTGGHGLYHAERVQAASILRRLEAAGYQIVQWAENPEGPADQVLEAAERLVFDIAVIGQAGSALSLEEIVREAGAHIDALSARDRPLSGLSTGFRDLDEVLAGLQDSELIVLAARPSVGKTALGVGIARNVLLEERRSVFFASLEQSRVELALRLMCAEAGVDGQRLRRGLLTSLEVERLRDAADTLRRLPLHIDDCSQQSMLRIAANARRLQSRGGLGLVVVDYLQLIDPDNRREPRQEQVAGISRRLKHLARELKVPVLALAQLNRGVEDRAGQRPRLSDLRESGAIEADADVVLLLHRPVDSSTIEVLVAKQRNGPTGEVCLAFRKECMRYEDFAAGTPFGGEAI
jgi:replicative DNA helicase